MLDKFNFYIGFKYDYYNSNYKKMIDPASPEKTFNIITLQVKEEGLVDTEGHSFFSPKINLNYVVSDKISVTTIYSQNVQSHPYNYILEGFNSIGYHLVGGLISFEPVKPGDLKPVVTKDLEIQLSFTPKDNLNLDITLLQQTQ